MTTATFAAILLVSGAPQDAKTIPLFNGKDLVGWTADVPDRDKDPSLPNPFVVRDGLLVSLGKPMGHLITTESFKNYRLVVEWRWPKDPGNSGVIVHVSEPRALRDFLPKGIEAQLMSGNAGDFHLFQETLHKPGAAKERAGKKLVEGAERPVGEWNAMIVECREDEIKVWVNGTLVNHGVGSSARKGKIALQSEGAEIEFRKVELAKL